MVKQDYYSSPLSVTSQYYFCPMPLRLDTYSGCTNNCLYCFANNSVQKFSNNLDNLKLATLHDNDFVKPTKLAYVKKYFDIAFEGAPNNMKNQEACAIEALKRRIPIHFGGMSDPFQPKEKTQKVTLKVLKLLKKYNYPVIISTKCSLICEPEYFEVINDYKNCGIQVSLIDDRQEVMAILEGGVGAESVAERLRIFATYKHKWTACRIQPFIIELTDAIIPRFILTLSLLKVNHVMVEGLKFMSGNPQANTIISKAFKQITGEDFDLQAHYKSLGAHQSGTDLELPTWRKKQYIDLIKPLLDKYGMTLGAADNDLRSLGNNPCCCGNADMPGIKDVCKHNIGFAIQRAKDKGVPITYSLIENDWFWSGDFRMVMSIEKLKAKYGQDATYETANRPIKDLFMRQWLTQGKNSPLQNSFVKYANKHDEAGRPIYEFKPQLELDYLLKPQNQVKIDKYF